MKRKSYIKMLALLLVMVVAGATTARGQIFIVSDEEHNGSNRIPEVGSGQAIIPIQNITTDQYTPLGGSIGLLCGLGLAYVLLKKKEEK